MIDPAKTERIKEITEKTLRVFSEKYTLKYKEALVEKIVDDIENGDKDDGRQLLERPPPTDPVKTGYLVKRGDIKHSWKKRFFVVRANYLVDYFESEAAFQANAAPKGTMRLSGYEVLDDPNKAKTERLIQTFKELKVEEEVAAIEKYPQFCFECHCGDRRRWLLQASNEEEFKEWVETFRMICRRAPGITNEDPVARAAFHSAIRETRWALGRAGWWGYGGTEEEILSDLVFDELRYEVLWEIWDALTGPPKMRRTARTKTQAAVRGIINPIIGGAWKAASATIITTRPTIEEGLKKAVEPCVAAQNDLVEKIKDKAMATIEPARADLVAGPVGKALKIIGDPIKAGFSELLPMFEKRVDEYHDKAAATGLGDIQQAMRPMYYHAHRYSNMYDAFVKVRDLYQPLRTLDKVVEHLYVWDVIYFVQDKMEKILENAFYTFEDALRKGNESGTATADGAKAGELIQGAKAETLGKLRNDAFLDVVDGIKYVLEQIVMTPFEKKVVGPCTDMVAPLEDAIPDAVKDFVSAAKCLEKLLVGIVEDCITKAIEPALEQFKF